MPCFFVVVTLEGLVECAVVIDPPDIIVVVVVFTDWVVEIVLPAEALFTAVEFVSELVVEVVIYSSVIMFCLSAVVFSTLVTVMPQPDKRIKTEMSKREICFFILINQSFRVTFVVQAPNSPYFFAIRSNVS